MLNVNEIVRFSANVKNAASNYNFINNCTAMKRLTYSNSIVLGSPTQVAPFYLL